MFRKMKKKLLLSKKPYEFEKKTYKKAIQFTKYIVYNIFIIGFNILYIKSYIMLLNFVKLSTLLIKKGSHKPYAMPTALVVV